MFPVRDNRQGAGSQIDGAAVGPAPRRKGCTVVQQERAGIDERVADRALERQHAGVGDDAIEERVGAVNPIVVALLSPLVERRAHHAVCQHARAADNHLHAFV